MRKIYIFLVGIFLLFFNPSFRGAFGQCSVNAGNDVVICRGQNTQLTAIATGIPNYTYSWSPVTGLSNNTIFNPVATPTITTTYSVTVTDASSCTATDQVTITVNPWPAAFTGPASAICLGKSTQLGTNPVPGNTYLWSSNPLGFTSLISNPVVSPTVTTTYSLTETITATGCSRSNSVVVTVNPLPNVNFTFLPNNNCASIPVNFTYSYAPAGLTFLWNFGDPASGINNTSTLANPTHIFESYGNSTASFNVKLKVTNGSGCKDSVPNIVTVVQKPDVTLTDPNNLPPFTHCSSAPEAFLLLVQYTPATVTTNINYHINWGDGSPQWDSTAWRPGGIYHTFDTVGSFNLVFSITRLGGCSNSKTYAVFNGSNPNGGINYDAGSLQGCKPHVITFRLNGAAQYNAPTTQYYFDFGDGTAPTTFTQETMPILNYLPDNTPYYPVPHSYDSASCTAPGHSFTLKSYVKNPCDSIPNDIGGIKVSKHSVTDFSRIQFQTDPIMVCQGVPYTYLNNTVEGCIIYGGNVQNATNYYWDFYNDGTVESTQTNPTYTFLSSGTYQIKLKSITGQAIPGNCGPDSIIRTVCVQAPPVADFTVSNDTFCINTPIIPVNISTTDPSCSTPQYVWTVSPNSGFSFIGNTNQNSFEPDFNFTVCGQYTITLTVKVYSGAQVCNSATHQVTITIIGTPVVTINAPGSPYCTNGTYTFTMAVNNCFGNLIPGSQHWIVDGGAPVPGNVPLVLTGLSATNHTIIADAQNQCGTGTSPTLTFTVYDIPVLTTNPTTQTFCSGGTAHIVLTSTPAGATFTWTATGTPASVTGYSNGSGTVINQPLANSGPSAGSVTYHITPSLGGCTGIPVDVIVFVNPAPALTTNPAGAQSKCAGDPLSIVLISSFPVPCDSISWTVTGTAGISGFSNGSGCAINQTLVNTGCSPGTATYSIQAHGNGCPGPLITRVITVNPLPVLTTNPLNSQICSQQSTNITLTSCVAGTTFTWTCTPSSLFVTGYSSGSGAIISQTLANNGINPETVTYHITPHANGCDGAVTDFIVTVNPRPVPTISGNFNVGLGVPLDYQTEAGKTLYIWTVSPGGTINSGAGTSSINVTWNVSAGQSICVNYTNEFGCPALAPACYPVIVNPFPTVFNMMGGDTICQGDPCVPVWLDNSENGVDYELFQNGLSMVPQVIRHGDGDSVSFGCLLQAGVYTSKGTNLTSGLSMWMNGQAVIVINPRPVSTYVIGSTGHCQGDVITLNGSQAGVSYQLYNGLNPSGLPLTGPGPLNFGPQNNPGVYTIKATFPLTGCWVWIAGSILITQGPQQYAFMPSGPGCAGDSISLANSETGVIYVLWCYPTVGTPQNLGSWPGFTGSPIHFGAWNIPGTYKVFAYNAFTLCGVYMTDEKILWENPLQYNITPIGGPFCGLVTIGLSNSQSGYFYEVHDKVANNIIITPDPNFPVLTGTGNALTFGTTATPGTYVIIGFDPNQICSTVMFGEVTVLENPTQYWMVPTGTICIDQSVGLEVKLQHSDIGIKYTLTNGTQNWYRSGIGGPGPLSFGFISIPGTYTISAQDTVNNCVNAMLGSLTIQLNPTRFTVHPLNPSCPGTEIWLSGSQQQVTYTLHPPVGAPISLPGSGLMLSWGLKYQPGSYYITAQSNTTSCFDTMIGTAIIKPNPAVFDVRPQGINCELTDIGMFNAEANVTYEIVYQDGSSLPVPVTKTPLVAGPFWFGVPQPAGTYRVKATLQGCDTLMNGIVVIDPRPTADAGPPEIAICNVPPYSVNLAGTASHYASVKWTSPTNPSGSNFLDPFSLITTYTLTPLDIANNQVILTLNAYGTGGCVGTDTLDRITVDLLAVAVNAGPDQHVCENETVQLAGSVTGGTTTGIWSGGLGTFNPGRFSPTAIYTPDVNETGTTVKLTLTSTNASPCLDVSDSMNITIYNHLNAGIASTIQTTVCKMDSVTLTATGPTGGSGIFTFQWQRYNGAIWVDATGTGSTTLSYNTGPLIATTRFRLRQRDTFCNPDQDVYTNELTITVNNIDPGSIAADQTICEGDIPAPFTSMPPSGDGTITFLWMQSPNGISGWIPAAGTNTNEIYSAPSLITDTWYKRVVTSTLSGKACTKETNIIKVTVNNLNAGSIGADQTICEGDVPASFTSLSPTGDGIITFLWMQSPDGISGWLPASGINTNETYSAPSLIADTWYKRVVTSTIAGKACSKETNVLRVTVNNVTPGSIAADQTICEGDIPASFTSVSPTGDGVITFLWMQSPDGIAGWISAVGLNTNETYQAPVLFADTWYKRVVTSTLPGKACSKETNILRVTVNNVNPGSIAADQTICEGDIPASFTSISPSGDGTITFLWMESPDGVSGWIPASGINTSETYSAPSLIADTWYKRVVTSTVPGKVCSKETNIVRVTVNNLTAGSITADQTICEGDVPASFTSVPPTGDGVITFLWMQSPDGVAGWIPAAGINTGATYTAPALLADTWFKRVVTSTLNGKACSKETNILRVTVNNVDPGSIAADQTVCEGDIPNAFTSISPAGDGVITYLWMQSPDGLTGWIAAAGINTNETYAAPALIADTWYKRVVTSTLPGKMCSKETNIVRVTVNNITVGSIAADQTICEGDIPAAFTSVSPTADGVITYLWMQSPDGISGWIPAGGVNANETYAAPALLTDTWYKRVVTSIINGKACTKETNILRVTVNNLTAGLIAADQTICEGDIPAPFTSVSPIGEGTITFLWMQSPDGITGWLPASGSNSSETYSPPALVADTWYKRVVTSTLPGKACSKESNILKITVNNVNPGAVLSDQTICEGDVPASFTSVSPTADGVITYLWMQSPDGASGWSPASGINTNETYSAPALIADTWYKRVVTSTLPGKICSKETNILRVTVNNVNAGSIAADQTICEGEVPATFTSVSPVADGAITYLWMQSPDGISGWVTATGLNTNETYSAPALMADTWYKRVVTSTLPGKACSKETNIIRVTVNNVNPGSIAADQTICEGDIPFLLTSVSPTGDGGITFLWMQSPNGVSGWIAAAGANTNETYQAPALMADTWYKRVVTSTLTGKACSKETNIIRVTVNNVTAGSIAADQTICEGDVPAAFTSLSPTADGAITFLWMQSPDGVTGWVAAAGLNTNETYSAPALIADTWFKRVVTSTLPGKACSKETNIIKVTVNNVTAGSIAADQILCEGEVPVPFTSVPPTADGGITYLWKQSPDGISGWVPAAGSNTGETYSAPALIADTWYKRVVTSTLTGKLCSKESNIIRVTVNNITPGSIAANQSICEGEIPASFTSVTPTGDGGITYLWMQSPDGIFGWIPAAGTDTNETYSAPALTTDTWYKRVVTSTLPGKDCSKETNILKVTVNPKPQNYHRIFPDDGSYCHGANGVIISLDGAQQNVTYDLILLNGPANPVRSHFSSDGLPFNFLPAVTDEGWYKVWAHWNVNGLTCGAYMMDSVYVYERSQIVVDFTYDTVCFPDPVIFNANYNGTQIDSIKTWSWNFGDGTPYSTDFVTTSHTYAAVGTYLVWLVVTDYHNCKDSTAHWVKVNPLPFAAYSWDTPNCNGSPVQFHNLSLVPFPYSGYIAKWKWDFGDGSSQTIVLPNSPNIQHIFDTSTLCYNVILTVWTGDSCTASVVHTVCNLPKPYANFQFSTVNCAGQPIQFTDDSQWNGGGNNATWNWYFDDSSSGTLNQSTSQNPVHTFSNGDSTYYVRFIATNTNMCSDTIIKPVFIHPSPPVDFTSDTACLNQLVHFNGNTGVTQIDSIVSWSWDFGDGSAPDNNPETTSHMYTIAGTFTTVLTVTDHHGCMSSRSHTVHVNPLPVPNFSWTTPNCEGKLVHFTDHSTVPEGYLAKWQWHWGDGSTDTTIALPGIPNISHRFLGNSTQYLVILTVWTNDSCSTFIQKTVNITPAPIANFQFSNVTCAGQTVHFTDLSQTNGGGLLTTWNWNFGDPSSGSNNFSFSQNPLHIYGAPGSYQVTMVVGNATGCDSTWIDTVTIHELPTANFRADTACQGLPTQFIDLSIANAGPSGSIISYSWDFGDGSPVNHLVNPPYTYSTAGVFTVTLTIVNSNGCIGSVTHQVLVNPKPTAAFTYSTPDCEGTAVSYTDLSTTPNGYLGYIKMWTWHFDDWSADINIIYPDSPDITHTFGDTALIHNVTLTVTTSDGCVNSITHQIISIPAPVANFIFPSTSCAGQTTQFTDQSQLNGGGGITNWSWNFGDPSSGGNNQSNAQNPIHIFTGGNTTYNVTLQVTNSNGCTDTIVKSIVVDSLPVASFNADTVCLGNPTQFTNTSGGGTITQYSWQFGDGGTSTLQSPTHTYATAGTFNVILTVTTNHGCINSYSRQVMVIPTPVANFTFSTPTCAGNDSVYFTDLSVASYGTLVKWVWDFGDGSPIVTINAPNSPDVWHTYSTGGSFTAMLTVYTGDSCRNIKTLPVVVQPAPVPNFSFSPIQCEHMPVQFSDLSQQNGGTPITSWEWNFGDPASGILNNSSQQNPAHTFNSFGNFIVSLMVTNAYGCHDTVTKPITINQSPLAMFTFDTACLSNPTQFTDASVGYNGNIVHWDWNFGEPSSGIQNTSTLQNPTHSYASIGIFNVTLEVRDSGLCVHDTMLQVYVNPSPQAMFEFSAGCVHDSVQFTDLSIAPGSSLLLWHWNFGDGGTSNIQDPKHAYLSAGTYNVTEAVTNLSHCVDSVTTAIVIRPKPVAAFDYHSFFCPPGEVHFEDLSTGVAAMITSRLWTFMPGSTSDQVDPVFTFPQTNTTYPVSLVVTDEYGCMDTVVHNVIVKPGLSFTFDFDTACYGQINHFTPVSNTTGDSLSQVIWNFGDPGSGPNNTSTDYYATHVFTTTERFIVTLRIKDKDNCVDSVSRIVSVNKMPVPAFTYSGKLCDSIHFHDNSSAGSGSIARWIWDFGDTTALVNILAPGPGNTTHFYLHTGYHKAILTVVSSDSCSDTISRIVHTQPCIQAVIQQNDTVLCSRNLVKFKDNSLPVPGITQWRWIWGDQSPDSVYTTYKPYRYHAYANEGTYIVKLIINALIDGELLTDSTTIQVTLRKNSIADFTANPVCWGKLTTFTNKSDSNDIHIYTYTWLSGKDTLRRDSIWKDTIRHKFDGWGQYHIALVIHNANNCNDTMKKVVLVNKLPVAAIDTPIYACARDYARFKDISKAFNTTISRWEWYFNDPNKPFDSGFIQNPAHIYDLAGIYRVSLKVTDRNACFDTTTALISVDSTPIALFKFTTKNSGGTTQLLMENLSTGAGGASPYFWNFGNGTTTHEENPTATYKTEGTYLITLIAKNKGCADTTLYQYDLFYAGLYIPNAFSPSNPNLAVRLFKPVGSNLREYNIQVFDSWGHQLWESTTKDLDTKGSPGTGWDGTFNGQPMPQGTYMWKASAVFMDGTIWQGSDIGKGDYSTFGTVTLIR